MKASSQIIIALTAVVIAQVQEAGSEYIRGGPKAFSVYRKHDWKSDGTIKYDGIAVDTTVGWIDHSTGEFVAPEKGVYRFTFTGNVFCPPPGECNGEISLMADNEIIATNHQVNANFEVVEMTFF